MLVKDKLVVELGIFGVDPVDDGFVQRVRWLGHDGRAYDAAADSVGRAGDSMARASKIQFSRLDEICAVSTVSRGTRLPGRHTYKCPTMDPYEYNFVDKVVIQNGSNPSVTLSRLATILPRYRLLAGG